MPATFFPHDEFYDASMRDVVSEIAQRAAPGTRIASESPTVATYYAHRAGRWDLVCVSLSDPEVVKKLNEGDFIVDARGRRYFSNELVLSALRQASKPVFEVSLGAVPSASAYELDQKSRDAMIEVAKRLPPLAKNLHPLVVHPAAAP